MPRRRRRLELDEGRLEYLWHGPAPAEAPTLVFLHQGLGAAALWRDLPEAVAAATGCGALVYSRLGHGESDARPAPWPLDFMHREALDVLPRVLAALAIETCVLVGHSDGASIALIHAGTAPAPGLRGLVLEAPHLFTEAGGLASIAELRRRFRCGDLAARLARHHGRNTDAVFAGWAGVWLDPAFADWSLEALVPEVAVPMLVVQGLDDPYGTTAHLRAIERRARAPVESLTLAGVGHAPHHEARAAYLERVVPFIIRCLD